MSLVNTSTAEPSHSTDGEGCQDRAKANPVKNGRGWNDARKSGHHCGGVSGGGVLGRLVGIRDEISPGGRRRPSAGTSGEPAKRPASTARAMNDHGKPDAGKPPVRFDEGRGVPPRTDHYGRFNLHV